MKDSLISLAVIFPVTRLAEYNVTVGEANELTTDQLSVSDELGVAVVAVERSDDDEERRYDLEGIERFVGMLVDLTGLVIEGRCLEEEVAIIFRVDLVQVVVDKRKSHSRRSFATGWGKIQPLKGV